MTYEQKLQIIRGCIDDIKELGDNNHLSANEKQQILRAIDTYTSLLDDAEQGKMDIDLLHENISSFLYYVQ
ncbi:MAG: hypothetical protein N2489_10735 [Clostridia bacterium]|nr:hypothetical protein [Clostridia bacterium]